MDINIDNSDDVDSDNEIEEENTEKKMEMVKILV